MAHRALPFALLSLLSIAACAAPGDEEQAADDEALSGGPDLASFIKSSKEAGDVDGVKFVAAADSAIEVGRPGEINYVVIHDVEGSGRSAANTFMQPGKESSAHYVVDKLGASIQMVREQNIANHAFHSIFNAYAIGIEHAGFAKENGYTTEEYEESSRITASIVSRYHIPIDRKHIVGHYQVPTTDTVVAACAENATRCGGQGGHVDPGPSWDWSRYLALVQKKAAALGYAGPTPAEQARRALVTVETLQTLLPSKPLFGGYYATQCDAAAEQQTTYRTIAKAKEVARLESRYLQPRIGECGKATDGVFPLVLRGFPTKTSETNLDLRGVTIEKCIDHKKQVFRFDGLAVPSGRHEGDVSDPLLALVSTGGC